MNQDKLNEILEKHQKWIDGEEGGELANLRNANLSGADLSGADLWNANLSGAKLSGADLRNADLRNANLRNANLRNANLRNANLSGAKLSGADLSGADLWNANLRNANLWNTTGNMVHIKSIFVETYAVVYTYEYLQIGCERHTIEEWKGFDEKRIEDMDGKEAVDFWDKYKNFIFQVIELSPATPAKDGE